MSNQNKRLSPFTAGILGALIGGAAVFLTDEKNRQKLKDKALDLKKQAEKKQKKLEKEIKKQQSRGRKKLVKGLKKAQENLEK